MTTEPIFRNNAKQKRYELQVGDQTAVCEYMVNNEGTIYLTHVEVPAALEGGGFGSELVKRLLTDIRDGERKCYPICPFVIAYLKRNPEWLTLIK